MIKNYSIHRAIMSFILNVQRVNVPDYSEAEEKATYIQTRCNKCPFRQPDFRRLMGIEEYNITRQCRSIARDRAERSKDTIAFGCTHEMMIRMVHYLIDNPHIEVTRRRNKK